MKTSLCVLGVFLPFFLGYTSALAAGQWDGTWTGRLDSRSSEPKCVSNYDGSVKAEVKEGIFQGLAEFQDVGEVRPSGKLRAKGKWNRPAWTEKMSISGKFTSSTTFDGKYKTSAPATSTTLIRSCKGEIHLIKQASG